MNKFAKIFSSVMGLSTSVLMFNGSVNAMSGELFNWVKQLHLHHPLVEFVPGSLENSVKDYRDKFYGETIFEKLKELASYIDEQLLSKINNNKQNFLYLWNAVNNCIGESVQRPLQEYDKHFYKPIRLWLVTDKLNNPMYLFHRPPLTQYLGDNNNRYNLSVNELNLFLESYRKSFYIKYGCFPEDDYYSFFSIEYVYFPQDDLGSFTIFLGDYNIYIVRQPDPTKQTDKIKYTVRLYRVGQSFIDDASKSLDDGKLTEFYFYGEK